MAFQKCAQNILVLLYVKVIRVLVVNLAFSNFLPLNAFSAPFHFFETVLTHFHEFLPKSAFDKINHFVVQRDEVGDAARRSHFIKFLHVVIFTTSSVRHHKFCPFSRIVNPFHHIRKKIIDAIRAFFLGKNLVICISSDHIFDLFKDQALVFLKFGVPL